MCGKPQVKRKGPYLVGIGEWQTRLERRGESEQGVHKVQHEAQYAFSHMQYDTLIIWDSFQTKLLGDLIRGDRS